MAHTKTNKQTKKIELSILKMVTSFWFYAQG